MACGAAFKAWPPAGQCLEIKAGGKSQVALRPAADGQHTKAHKPNRLCAQSRTRFRVQSRALFRTRRGWERLKWPKPRPVPATKATLDDTPRAHEQKLNRHPAPLLQRRRASPERQRWNAIA